MAGKREENTVPNIMNTSIEIARTQIMQNAYGRDLKENKQVNYILVSFVSIFYRQSIVLQHRLLLTTFLDTCKLTP